MKQAFLMTLAFVTGLSFAQGADLGEKIEFSRTEAGQPAFGLTYMEAEAIWLSFSIPASASKGRPWPAYFAFVDMNSGRMLSPWMDAHLTDTPSSDYGIQQDIVDAPVILDIMKNLKNSAIVISFRRSPPELSPSVYLDMREFCANHPSAVTDADGRKGCP